MGRRAHGASVRREPRLSARATLANLLWAAASLPAHDGFRRAVAHPRRVQTRLLLRYLRENASTAFGRAHGFARIRSLEEYRARVPMRDYDGFRPFVERIADGEAEVLTRAPVRLLEPTGGSTGGSKWIPYTTALQSEYRRAVASWILDLFRHRPSLLGGPAYWSITPAADARSPRPTRVPVGFEEDSAYLGGLLEPIVRATLAVPGGVRGLDDVGEFRRATLVHLLRARELRLISVWHPTFLMLLLDAMSESWSDLLATIATGLRTGRARLDTPADPARARELARLGPGCTRDIWPRLALISSWGDSTAALSLDEVRRAFPGVEVQAKGLLSTEGIVTFPYGGTYPLAITSHFFEFEDAAGNIHAAWELSPGGVYSVVLTTGGGLYRYRLHDLVEVTGRLSATPCLRFLGKTDRVSDRFGEKLDEAFVDRLVTGLLRHAGISAWFVLLAPEVEERPARYVLFLGASAADARALATLLEEGLRENPQYAYAVRLGQLAPAEVCLVDRGAPGRYIERLRRSGMRLGDIKPAALSPLDGWRATFVESAPTPALVGGRV